MAMVLDGWIWWLDLVVGVIENRITGLSNGGGTGGGMLYVLGFDCFPFSLIRHGKSGVGGRSGTLKDDML